MILLKVIANSLKIKKQNEDNLNIDNKINSVIGSYIKDKTSLIVYNFFSVNYSIEKFYFTNKHYQEIAILFFC